MIETRRKESRRVRRLNVLALALAGLLAPSPTVAQRPESLRAPATSGASVPPAATSAAAANVTVDHSAYDALLRRHVVNGEVDYAAFAREPSFARYLASLDRVDPTTLDDEERLAFWINVYNAFTIQLVAQSGETSTIRNINKTLGVLRLKGPWSAPIVRAAGRTLSLDDVQHTILRKQFNEPRIHFAIVYAAKSSPPLRSEAYRGAGLESQLVDQGRRFLRESWESNRLERVGRRRLLMLSPVFSYYRKDFAATRADLGRFLAPWFEGEDREALEKGTFMTQPTTFDWALNGVGSRTVAPAK